MGKFFISFICLLSVAVSLGGCKKKEPAETKTQSIREGIQATSEQNFTQSSPTPQYSNTPQQQASIAENQPQAPKTIDLPDPVAVVNGVAISRAEFEKLLAEVFQSMGIQQNMLPAEQMPLLYRQFAEDLVIDKLIDLASANVTVTPEEVDKEVADIVEQYGSQERLVEELKATNQTLDDFKKRLTKILRQRKFMSQQAGKLEEVSESEIRSFYEKNKSEFEQPEVVRASHILIRVDEGADEATVEAKKKQAEEIAQKAKAGEDFGKLAEQYSEDPSAKHNAGDLNYFPRERMVPQFSEAAFSQEVNTVSDPVRTPFGWHIIKVTDKKPAQTLPYEQVRNDIAEYLKESRTQQANNRIIQKLRSEADIQIFIPIPSDSSLVETVEPKEDAKKDETNQPQKQDQESGVKPDANAP
ncbi:MAG: peptidylprolyl isomerase [Chthoniobacterales bacterium]|nr:peptidylprolyl isomerase [Chthoniobacterales bacterium]